MLRKIRVYGQLAKFLGRRVFHAEVASAAEAVRFLVANFPALETHMADQHYRVSTGTYQLGLDELHDPAGQQEIKIVPVLAGAGGDGMSIGKILLGIALIAVSIIVPAATFGLTSMLGVGLFGASMVIYGAAALLTPTTPTPTNTATKNPQESYSFSGIQNTSRQGLPLPILMGEIICGSITVSAGIDVAAIKA